MINLQVLDIDPVLKDHVRHLIRVPQGSTVSERLEGETSNEQQPEIPADEGLLGSPEGLPPAAEQVSDPTGDPLAAGINSNGIEDPAGLAI
jgi:hypothetical protein